MRSLIGMEGGALHQLDLLKELLRRGYIDEDIRKLLGLNVLRVMRAVEKVATGMRSS